MMMIVLAFDQLEKALDALCEYDQEYWRRNTYVDDYDTEFIRLTLEAWKQFIAIKGDKK